MELFNELYQEIILAHYKNPSNAANLDHLPEEKVHENPTCGDSIKVHLHVDEEGRIDIIEHDTRGCAICVSSASLMSELLKGQNIDEARGKISSFIKIMRGEEPPDLLEEWGDISCLKGILQYPARIKCATLAWHAAEDSL